MPNSHPILSDIEKCYIGQHGRDWLHDENEARCELVLGKTQRGLLWFDQRELWQIFAAFLIVFCTILGAFFLSFFTPTVGLGCRSGGYSIFTIIAVALMLCEMFVWWLTSPVGKEKGEPTSSPKASSTDRYPSDARWHKWRDLLFSTIKSGTHSILTKLEDHAIKCIGLLMSLRAPERRRTEEEYAVRARAALDNSRPRTTREWTDCCFFRPLEALNASWLLYMSTSQTIGAFTNCECMTSSWGPKAGYMDFTQWSFTKSPWAK